MKSVFFQRLYLLFLSITTIIYTIVFFVVSKNTEFFNILHHAKTINQEFWGMWNIFFENGNLKLFGYLYIFLLFLIFVFYFRGTKNEHINLDWVIIILWGGSAIIQLCCFLLILSDPVYAIEFATFTNAVWWGIVLICTLLFVSIYRRSGRGSSVHRC